MNIQYRAWVHDGKPWFEHTCIWSDGVRLDRSRLPTSAWSVVKIDGTIYIRPSVHCSQCGLHTLGTIPTGPPPEDWNPDG